MSNLKFGSQGFYGFIDKQLNKWMPVTLQQADRDDIRQDVICRAFQLRRSHFSNELIEACVDRAVRQWRRVRSRNSKLHTSDFDSLDDPTYNVTHQGELSEVDRIYLRIDMKKFIANLTPFQQKICRMLMEDKTVRRVAKCLKTSSRAIQQELQLIRETFEQAS